MSLTIRDMIDRLRLLDEVTLLEVLNLSSEEIVDRFEDVIEDRFDTLLPIVDDDDQETEDEETPW
jgi:hypothetical protein